MTLDFARVAIAALVVGFALALALALGRRRRRQRGFDPLLARIPTGALVLTAPLTAVFFTSRLCAECRETRSVVRDAAPELAALEVSVHERPDLVRALGVSETPTILLVDAVGRIRYARAGNPTPLELWTYARECWDSLGIERVAA